VIRSMSPRGQLALRSSGEPIAAVAIRSGREVSGLAEALYLRMFVLALGGMVMMCGLVIVAATVRTVDADFVRTVSLALGLGVLAGLALRAPRRVYFAMRFRPALSLIPPMLALLALVIDGVGHSPLSYPAAVSTAYPAFVCGRRWALTAATMIAVGAVTAATLRTGPGALNSVGQGAVGYFAWALVLSGLAESFTRLIMRMPQIKTSPSLPPPAQVINLAGDPLPSKPAPSSPPAAQESAPEPVPSTERLTARQLQVVVLLADGLRANQIAQQLGIATSTVYRYVERAKERTGVASRSELVALVIREGLVPANTTDERSAQSAPDR
jgi:DNA-binding CsgD family transcriptional regulator